MDQILPEDIIIEFNCLSCTLMKNVKSISSLQWSLVEQRHCLAERFPYFLHSMADFSMGKLFFSSPSVCHFYEDMNVLTSKLLSTFTHSYLTSFAIANYRVIYFLFQRDETFEEPDICFTP